MKKITFLFSAFAMMLVAGYGQPYMNPNILSVQGRETTLGDVQKAFNQYWSLHDPDQLNEQENAEEGGYQQFQRAAAFMKQRTYPSGKLFNPEILYKEYQSY